MPLPSGLKQDLMQKFTIELLFQIIGIGSASGLFYKDNSVSVIGDNSGFLYDYHIGTKDLRSYSLVPNAAANIPKKQKPDFEAMAFDNDNFYIFGSGSTENRNKMVQFDKASKTAVKTTDLTDLYLSMQSFGNIKPEDFNIEGAALSGETWYFLQRGNGSKGKNILFTVEGKTLENGFTILSNDFKLPKIKGVRCSFTDALLIDDHLYFLAAAENSKSTYEDGEVLGSIIGRINIDTMKIEFTQQISDKHKFEGLALYSKTDTEITFLLCEDNDTDVQQSDFYKLTLKK